MKLSALRLLPPAPHSHTHPLEGSVISLIPVCFSTKAICGLRSPAQTMLHLRAQEEAEMRRGRQCQDPFSLARCPGPLGERAPSALGGWGECEEVAPGRSSAGTLLGALPAHPPAVALFRPASPAGCQPVPSRRLRAECS